MLLQNPKAFTGKDLNPSVVIPNSQITQSLDYSKQQR
jgi:hypothetical protein